jgi:hypothetical protein
MKFGIEKKNLKLPSRPAHQGPKLPNPSLMRRAPLGIFPPAAAASPCVLLPLPYSLSSHLSPLSLLSLTLARAAPCPAPPRRQDSAQRTHPGRRPSRFPRQATRPAPARAHAARPAATSEQTRAERPKPPRSKPCPTRCSARARSRISQAPCTVRPFDFSPLMELQLLHFFLLPLFLSLKPTPLSSVMELNADRSVPGRPSLSSPFSIN